MMIRSFAARLLVAIFLGSTLAAQETKPQRTPEEQKEIDTALKDHDAAFDLFQQGKVKEAAVAAERALAVRQRILGEENAATASTHNNLGFFYVRLGDLPKAKKHHELALAARLKVFGDAAKDTALSYGNLASVLESQRDYKGAAQNHLAAAAVWTKASGEEKAETGTAYHNGGWAQYLANDGQAARTSLEQALKLRRKVLGNEHVLVAQTLNSLAIVTEDIDFRAARPLYEEALAIREKALGDKDGLTAQSLANLANWYRNANDHGASLPLFERALAVRRNVNGEDDLSTADAYKAVGLALKSLERFKDSLAPFEKSLEIVRRRRGEEHAEVATLLNALATSLENLSDFPAAKRYYEQSLAIRRKVLGEQHASTATSLNNLGVLVDRLGDSPAARSYHEQALAIRKKLYGDNHLDVALSLGNLGVIAQNTGEYQAARAYFEQVLAIKTKLLPPDHFSLAEALSDLASATQELGDHAAARSLLERAVEINRQAGKETSETARLLSSLGFVLHLQHEPREARPLLERAVSISERIRGKDHLNTLGPLNNLAIILEDLGEIEGARRIFENSLRLRVQGFGDDHPSVTSSLNNLGGLLLRQGDYAAARPYLERALAVRRKAFGPENPETASSLNELAVLLKRQGDLPAAQALYEEALRIRRKNLGEKHLLTASSWNNLGVLEAQRKNHSAAKDAYEKALQIYRHTHGDDHPDTARAWSNLGALSNSRRDYQAALPALAEALRIQRKVFGEDHPETAMTLNNTAYSFHIQRNFANARPLHEQALKIRRGLFGDEHPEVVMSLNNLGITEASDGKLAKAAEYFDDARRGTARHVERVLPALSAAEQLAFLKANDELNFHAALSLGALGHHDPSVARRAAAWLINGKGVAQTALAAGALAARDERDPKRAELTRQLRETRQLLAQLALSAPQRGQETARRAKLEKLLKEEQSLSRKSAEANGTATSEGWVELDAVRAGLPPDGVLIDLLRLDPLDFSAKESRDEWRPSRYVAWITPPAGKGEVRFVDLGLAEEVDALVSAARAKLENAAKPIGSVAKSGEAEAEAQLRKDLQALAAKLWTPLAPHVKEARRLTLSPDGLLWLLPWSALPIDDSQLLLEKYSLRFVVSGRDVIRREDRAAKGPPTILANPSFDATAAEKRTSLEAVVKEVPAALPAAAVSSTGASTLPAVAALPATEAEARAVEPNLGKYSGAEVKVYLGEFALESIAKKFDRPRVAVFATHGFFLPEQVTKRERGEAGGTRGAGALDAGGKPVENPLLRCGLLLAGCNQRASVIADDDGVLSGMEICGIDFRGTELVVLSACETGIGQVNNGEGVAGLRQAFQLAGARAVVASLWQVPDRDSALIMNDFFAGLADGQSKADALRNAQLKRLAARRDRFGAAHPFFWAAWTITGD